MDPYAMADEDWITKGFSLVELIVVVAIISIMSVSTVVGFRYMGEGLRKQETKGIISDLIKRTELEILKGDYEKSTIHFLEEFFVIDGEVYDQDQALAITTTCTNGHSIQSNMAGTLYKKGVDGNLLEAGSILADTDRCIEFNNSDEREWQFQVVTDSDHSNILRFVHFNVNRDSSADPVLIKNAKIISPFDKLIIEAPYAKKTLPLTTSFNIGYKEDLCPVDCETLTIN